MEVMKDWIKNGGGHHNFFFFFISTYEQKIGVKLAHSFNFPNKPSFFLSLYLMEYLTIFNFLVLLGVLNPQTQNSYNIFFLYILPFYIIFIENFLQSPQNLLHHHLKFMFLIL